MIDKVVECVTYVGTRRDGGHHSIFRCHELRIYAGEMTDSDRDAIVAELKATWGITTL